MLRLLSCVHRSRRIILDQPQLGRGKERVFPHAANDSESHPVEIRLVEFGQGKLRASIQSRAWTCALVRERREVIIASSRRCSPSLLPYPHSDGVVIVPLQKIQVGRTIKRRWRVRATKVLEVAPRLRSSKINRLATSVGKVAGIRRVNPQGSCGRASRGHGCLHKVSFLIPSALLERKEWLSGHPVLIAVYFWRNLIGNETGG